MYWAVWCEVGTIGSPISERGTLKLRVWWSGENQCFLFASQRIRVTDQVTVNLLMKILNLKAVQAESPFSLTRLQCQICAQGWKSFIPGSAEKPGRLCKLEGLLHVKTWHALYLSGVLKFRLKNKAVYCSVFQKFLYQFLFLKSNRRSLQILFQTL